MTPPTVSDYTPREVKELLRTRCEAQWERILLLVRNHREVESLGQMLDSMLLMLLELRDGDES